MTMQMPPPEPLDAQERELARVLRALPGGEPPAALDASILRAATNAAAASRRPGARLLASTGALWGIGSAAAAVLALGVAIQMRMSPEHATGADSAPRAQAVSEIAEDDSVEVDLGQAQGLPEASLASKPPPPASPVLDQPVPAPRPASPLRREQAPLAASAPAAPPAVAPEPFAADALDEHVTNRANVAEAAAAAEGRQREDKEQYAAKSAAAQSPPPPAEAASARDARADLDTVSTVGGLAAGPRSDAPMKPATWIAEIRRLRDAGQIEAARARLVEFRRAYPQWVIPTDLAPLLSE